MSKRTVNTPRYAIARHWAAIEPRFVIDIGEPSCFACGWYDERWPDSHPLHKVWERTGLERAHLAANCEGGADEPSNLVLLCPRCHREAPMGDNPQHMLMWVRERERFWDFYIRQLIEALTQMKVDIAALLTLDRQEIQRAIETSTFWRHPAPKYEGFLTAGAVAALMRELLDKRAVEKNRAFLENVRTGRAA